MYSNLVIQTDFGLSDGAVNEMYGVAISVDPNLRIFDLTHEIPQYNIWEASYRLFQTVSYWPQETVFISVVDPGVGTSRRSVVVKTAAGQYIVTPDNGTLTHINDTVGIAETRVIDETRNRLPASGESHTFHGRDVYVYTGAKLAAGVISYAEVGPEIDTEKLVKLPVPKAEIGNNVITGTIDILDVRFGNLWTNIGRELLENLGITYGEILEVAIENNTKQIYRSNMRLGRSFADSRLGEPLLFINSVDKVGVAINQGSFAKAYRIETGSNWKIIIQRLSEN